MGRKFKFSEGEFYHVYNRGVEKREVFLNKTYYNRFVYLLYLANSPKPIRLDNILSNKQGLTSLKMADVIFKQDKKDKLVDIGAYCLMPNHFHLLLKEKQENGISKFLQKLTTGYTMFFNEKNDRSGGLFEGTFKATFVDSDNYLKYLFAYVHLNPVKLIDPKWKENGIFDKEKAEKYLENYPFSSYYEYIGKDRIEKSILNKPAFPEYFSNTKDFTDFIEDWLSFDDEVKISR
jgi:putative transposase